MTIRLRRAPPRRRRGRPAPIFGVATLILASAVWLALDMLRPEDPRFLIEIVPSSALSAPVTMPRADDAGLVSLPPLAPPRPYLAEHRIVSFYGNPLAEVLGVLGAQSPEETVIRLRVQADEYTRISDDRTVVPAVHLIYAVAQNYPGEDGSYLLRMDDAMVERYVRLTRDNGMLLFLDIQMGRSTIEAELPRIAKFLRYDNVHVALDPEFAWGADGLPGIDIGRMDAEDVNQAQRMLQRLTLEQRLPTKILIVHQFLPGMLRNKNRLQGYDRVELVVDADGFGPRHVKRGSWQRVIVDDGVQLAAIKLFYKHDIDLMTPTDVLTLDPRPAIIIYQ